MFYWQMPPCWVRLCKVIVTAGFLFHQSAQYDRFSDVRKEWNGRKIWIIQTNVERWWCQPLSHWRSTECSINDGRLIILVFPTYWVRCCKMWLIGSYERKQFLKDDDDDLRVLVIRLWVIWWCFLSGVWMEKQSFSRCFWLVLINALGNLEESAYSLLNSRFVFLVTK